MRSRLVCTLGLIFSATIGMFTGAIAAIPPFYTDTNAISAAVAVQRQTATAAALGMPVVDTVWLADSVPMEMRLCPAANFIMGSPYGGEGDERCTLVVMPQPFYVSTYVLTQRQYKAFMGSAPRLPALNPGAINCMGGCGYVPMPGDTGYQPNYAALVNYWAMRDTVIAAMQRYAPANWQFACVTQAQMEYATRAGTRTTYYTGDDEAGFATSAWYNSNSGNHEHPVGQKIPNAWGFYDMLGNFWQWITGFRDASLGYDTHRSDNMHAVKGGAYWEGYNNNGCRSANVMVQMNPSGFRVAMNCTRNLMNPTGIRHNDQRSGNSQYGISVKQDCIVINSTAGDPGLLEFLSLNGKLTHVKIDAESKKTLTLRFHDLGLSSGAYLMRLSLAKGWIEQKVTVQW